MDDCTGHRLLRSQLANGPVGLDCLEPTTGRVYEDSLACDYRLRPWHT